MTNGQPYSSQPDQTSNIESGRGEERRETNNYTNSNGLGFGKVFTVEIIRNDRRTPLTLVGLGESLSPPALINID